jgi:hypothetical protein
MWSRHSCRRDRAPLTQNRGRQQIQPRERDLAVAAGTTPETLRLREQPLQRVLDLAELVTGLSRSPGPDLLLRVLRRGGRAEDGAGVTLRDPRPVRGQVGLLASEAAFQPGSLALETLAQVLSLRLSDHCALRAADTLLSIFIRRSVVI